MDIATEWIPEEAGVYELRAFLISNFTSPNILSDVTTSKARIEVSVPDKVWVAFNTTQCANRWDIDYADRQYSIDYEYGETIIKHYFKDWVIQVYKIRVEYLPMENIESCLGCSCASGKTLYLEVSSSGAMKIWHFGFVEQSPPSSG